MAAGAAACLDKRLLHLHGVEAIERVDDLHAGLGLVVQARDAPQPVHAPCLVPAEEQRVCVCVAGGGAAL